MRKSMILAAAIAALLAPAAARAQLQLGARLGWSIPAGEAFDGGDLSRFMTGAVPIQLDVGYAFGAFGVGIYAGYALGRLDTDISNQCDAVRLECGVRTLRAGLQATFTFEDASPAIAPWVGLGVGYESTKFETANILTYSGWEVPLQVGADWKATPAFRVGPFVSYALGQYLDDGTGSIDAKGTHSYVTLGLRGQFGL